MVVTAGFGSELLVPDFFDDLFASEGTDVNSFFLIRLQRYYFFFELTKNFRKKMQKKHQILAYVKTFHYLCRRK